VSWFYGVLLAAEFVHPFFKLFREGIDSAITHLDGFVLYLTCKSMETILGRDGSDVLGEVTNLGEMATNVDKLLAYIFILYEV
jgi:hypothetical protein